MGQAAVNIEQSQHRNTKGAGAVPGWVPRSVQNYIDHTEMGVPIRALARQQGCHASTILRQIRRVETLRDDPLVDGVLTTLGGTVERITFAADRAGSAQMIQVANTTTPMLPDLAQLCVDGLRVLRRLCETGAVLAVAADMEKAVIVRDGTDGGNTRTGVVDRGIAEAMALKGWISAPDGGRIARYQITAAGRSALADLMARDESALAGASFEALRDDVPRRIRYGLAESPLAALARRRDRDGERFLEQALVHAGERLREDFEMAQMGHDVSRNWVQFLAAVRNETAPVQTGGTLATRKAHARVVCALRELGPGLADITLRCCCFLEGLETAEKILGWSARSGKIVLRIALMRLREHYARSGAALIG